MRGNSHESKWRAGSRRIRLGKKSPHSYHRFPFKSDSRELQYNKNKKELNHMENGPMKVHQDYLDAYRF